VKFLHEGFLFINNRMDITSNQFLAALDSYMKENGGGAKYFATRMKRIFDNKDAPLNPKGALAKVISTLSTSATTISDTSKELKKSVTPFIKKLDTFGELLPGLSKSLKSFEKNIQALDIKKDKTTTPATKDIHPNTFTKTNLERITNFLLKKPLPITIQSVSPDVLNVLRMERNKEPVLPPPTIADKNKSSMVRNVVNNYYNKDASRSKDEEGSSLGKIIKGIIGTVVFVAGVGFLSQFLDTPVGKIIKYKIGNLKDKFMPILKFFVNKIIDYSVEGLKVLFFKLPKYFLKQTFNFFGLKEILGKENEGLAVILTKGIYYSVKNFFVKTLNGLTFGLFSKISKYIMPIILKPFTFFGDILIKIGKQFSDKITAPLKAIPRYMSIATGSVTNIFSKIGKTFSSLSIIPKAIMKFFNNLGFGAGGGIGKIIGSVTKLGGGSLLKLIGTMFKNVAKRIPFIGSLISFKDAYDRFKKGDILGGFISITSGIATFFPGIGTVVSIGLDVLNMVLDKQQSKPENQNKGKGSIIGNLIKNTMAKFFDEKRLLQIPLIGPLIKIAKGFMTLSSDPVEGMKGILKGIFSLNPITTIANAVSFIDFLMNGDVASDPNIQGSMTDWFNSDIWIDKIGGFVGGIVDTVMEKFSWIFGKVKSISSWIFGKAEDEIEKTEDSLVLPKKSTRRTGGHTRPKSPITSKDESSSLTSSDQQTTAKIKDIASQNQQIEIEKQEIKTISISTAPLILESNRNNIQNNDKLVSVDLKSVKSHNELKEKLDTIAELMAANIQATLQSGGQVASTVAATAGANTSSTSKNYGSGDSIREQKIRSAQAIETPSR